MPKAAAQRETRAGSSSQTRQGSSSRKGGQQANPVREKRDAGEEEQQEEEKEGRLEPSPVFTGHQMFYLFFLDGIGAMILSGGVNFALAYVMYTTQDTTKNPIRLFQLPNTLAGDAAVTIIIQCILTWFVEMGLVSYDLSNRSVQPIGFIPEPSAPLLRWLFYLPPSKSEETPEEDEPKSKIGLVLSSIVQQALRGFMLAVLGFLLLWGPSIGILTVFGVRSGGDFLYQDRWVPQAFKGILGGVLGLLTTPPMAAFWLMKAGWEGNKERTEARASRRSRYANAV
ncbi:hypothetical protein BHE90_000660 [Fusarium euwallaceae]|uniref:Uncharacterized protein n=3 Tax=Fusarium solani species complex TaxID=232080 RepID=A0A3M2RUC1_9HYPO|nr:hypothetical protein CDV36_011522 [Fusarium kuroshium]RSM08135.1 hypothetical protein CEP52_004851 [Fusarium oligoseptatum]RTE84809.1 hypothetical protein BHE90_000660 [Fusarium euwallaceae]